MTRTHLAAFAPNVVNELLEGRPESCLSITDFMGKTSQTTITHLIACDLCDIPESPLRSILKYIGAQAKAGDAQALALITKLADSIEAEYGTADREPDPQDRSDAAAEWLGVTQA